MADTSRELRELRELLVKEHAAMWLDGFNKIIGEEQWGAAMFGLHTGLAMAAEDPARALEVTHLLEAYMAETSGQPAELIEQQTRGLMRDQRVKREELMRNLR